MNHPCYFCGQPAICNVIDADMVTPICTHCLVTELEDQDAADLAMEVERAQHPLIQ